MGGVIRTGDARGASDDFDDNSYEDKQFVLSGIGALARFVGIVFIPVGPFFFTDEIEVEASGNERSLVTRLYTEDIVADAMNRSNGNRARTVERLANRVLDGLGAPVGNVSELRRAALLEKRFPGKEIILDTVTPWITDTSIDLPRDVFVSNQEIVVTEGSCAFRAFSISNPKSKNLVGSRHWRQASVGHTSNGVLSQTGQYNCDATALTSSSEGSGSCAKAIPVNNRLSENIKIRTYKNFFMVTPRYRRSKVESQMTFDF